MQRVSLLHQWKNCFAIWQIKGYHCWLYQIFYGLFDNSWNMFGSHIYCQHVVLFCLCLYENQATTNPYSWQGIMWIYMMITISKFIRNISWFIWESENSEYTGHYVLMYNSGRNHGKRIKFLCFVPYKMGFILFSKHFFWIFSLSPLFLLFYIKFMKILVRTNFSSHCPINLKMVYRFQYISNLFLIQFWFAFCTEICLIFSQQGKS